MSLGFLELPLWACIIVAFVPPALIALLGLRLSRRIDRANDNLMTTLARFSGAALVFISAFLVGTLWPQTTSALEAWRVEYHAAKQLQRSAGLLADEQGIPISQAVDGYLYAVRDHETAMSADWAQLWQGSDQGIEALWKIGVAIEEGAPQMPAGAPKDLREGVEKLVTAREQRFQSGVQPGTPLVMFMIVLLLAWTATLCLSLYPSGGQPWVKRLQATVVVIVVGLVQLPVYYLLGTGPVREFVAGLIP